LISLPLILPLILPNSMTFALAFSIIPITIDPSPKSDPDKPIIITNKI
jgi:hypothetical protein